MLQEGPYVGQIGQLILDPVMIAFSVHIIFRLLVGRR